MTDSNTTIHGFLGADFDAAGGALSVVRWTVAPAGGGDPVPLLPGDLVRVFNTVSAGDELWCDKIDLRGGHQVVAGMYWAHGMQVGTDPAAWTGMFFRNLPARLEAGGRVIYGSLEPFAETGTEGILWAVHEYGVAGYDGLHVLNDGDALTVYATVRDGAVAWEGTLDFIPADPGDGDIIGLPGGIPRGVDRREWVQMAFNAQPVIVQRPAAAQP